MKNLPPRFLSALALGLLASLPLLAPVAQAEPASSRWEKAIAAFEKADRENPPPEGAILFIGSSSIRGWRTVAADFPEYEVINRGFGGSRISDSIEFADRIILPYKPAAVLLYAGDNDLNGGLTPEQVAENFKKFVSLIHRELPETKIAFISIKPSPRRAELLELMREANDLIRDYAAQAENVDYIDVFTPMVNAEGEPRRELFVKDRLHFNKDGYDLWTKTVAPYLKTLSEKG